MTKVHMKKTAMSVVVFNAIQLVRTADQGEDADLYRGQHIMSLVLMIPSASI